MIVALLIAVASEASAQPVNGEVKVATTGGYARIVLRLAEEVESEVKLAGGILIVSFKKPINAPIESISAGAPDYITAARRDPDAMGFRIALSRKVTVNSMAAGERLFIDLLPESWAGVAPGLPQEVIEELAHRAREAERLLRQQRRIALERKPVLIKVRVASQPTFTRFVFALPDVIPVTSDRTQDNLTLVFAAPLNFDLADAKAAMPSVVRSIDAVPRTDSISVRFVFNDKADVRTFREDNDYIVDIGASDAKESETGVPVKPAELAVRAEKTFAGDAKALASGKAPQTIPVQFSASKPVAASAMSAAQPAAQPAKQAAKAEDPAPKSAPGISSPRQPTSIEAGAPRAAAPSAAPPAQAAISAPSPPERQGAPTVEHSAPAANVNTAAAEPPKQAPAVPHPEPGQPAAHDAAAHDAALPPRDRKAPVAAELNRQGNNLHLVFGFAEATPAAIFSRADMLWLVFDTKDSIDLSALDHETSGTIRSASVSSMRGVQIARLQLQRPRLVSVTADGPSWALTIGDAVVEPTKPLGIMRHLTGAAHMSMTIPFDAPKELHRIIDPEIGDALFVVTALGPGRGFLNAQDFVEFRALATTHGVVVQPFADDVRAELSADSIMITRPGGLMLSGNVQSRRSSPTYRPPVFDAQLWGFDRQSNFTERQYKLIAAAADAAEAKRFSSRLELARFYLSREMFAEAKAVLDVAMADQKPSAEDPSALILHAITNIMLDRPDQALKELADPAVGNQQDAPLWRAFAHARQGKWAQAQQGFKNVAANIARLPVELQHLALKEALRATIEVRDFAGATTELSEFEMIGVPRQMEPSILILTGRLAQGLGRVQEALKNFRTAADSADRPVAAEGRLREIALRYGLGDIKRTDAVSELETLTALWRGDDTEIEALQILARLYTEEGRYRDAFHVMRTALTAHPNSEMTRRIHDEAAATFDSLFLAGKGDVLPAIDALSLFYDFRELTPIGRRGDEMIRRLADRLVSVDLLKQAAELLQHQVDHRLQGAARAQVATRLAVIYLMDRKPDQAQAVLRATHMNALSTELRHLRLLLEARALSDLGRHDLALDIIADVNRREAIRLKSDILWAAKRWREAAEQIELLYGERWRDFEPLSDTERADLLRAAIGYALNEDKLGLGRLRERYASKMTDSPDRQAFDIATDPFGANLKEFRDLAKTIATVNTLDNFLREMRASYPELGAMTANDIKTRPASVVPMTSSDPSSTGSVARARAGILAR